MNLTDRYYSIAGLTLRLRLPEESLDCIPPSFSPFRCDAADSPALTATLAPLPDTIPQDAVLLDDTTADMGRVTLRRLPSDSYLVRLCDSSGFIHSMTADPAFSAITVSLRSGAPVVSSALASLLRIAFSQTVLLHGGISLHASAVLSRGEAFLFLGKSGTGKSTHARMWLQNIPDTILLNDDNPILRLDPDSGVIRAYGSPWSGKTPCYKAISAPVRAITRLEQAPANGYTPLPDVEAFAALLPSSSAIKSSPLLHDALCDTLALVAATIPVGCLRCLPDPSAAILLRDSLATSGRNVIKNAT